MFKSSKVLKAFIRNASLLMFLGATAHLVQAEKTIELQSTFVGDKEQPGVSYIMPWKPPEGPGKLYRPIDSISGNILEPLERDQLIHGVHYYEQMSLEAKESSK